VSVAAAEDQVDTIPHGRTRMIERSARYLRRGSWVGRYFSFNHSQCRYLKYDSTSSSIEYVWKMIVLNGREIESKRVTTVFFRMNKEGSNN